MSQMQSAVIWRHIRTLALAQGPSSLEDAQLLQTFIAQRDEAAFAALVHRHGAMVMAVCRGVLQHWQDAEDVFQAAFLVLARKAHTIRKHEALSSWLHGVAYRLALKARSRSKTQQSLTHAAEPVIGSADDLTLRELRGILHDELNRLPEKYRAPLLLCYWEGKTRDEAAEHLGVTSGAFKKCLERARNLLGSRLVGRGVVPSATLFTAVFFDQSVRAAVSSALIQTTAQAAADFAAGTLFPAGASATALALAKGAIRMMLIKKWAITILAITILGSVGAGLSLAAYRAIHGDIGTAPAGPASLVVEQQPKAGKTQTDKKTDAERFVGTWIFVDVRGPGEKVAAEFTTLARLTFGKDGSLAMTILDKAKNGKYKIVASGKLDFLADNEEISPGLYKFEGDDRVTICLREGGGAAKRPKDFVPEKDGQQSVFVLRRAKPGEERPTKEQLAKVGGLEKIMEAAARAQDSNNLKQIGLAMHAHHDAFNGLPAHAIYDKDGKTPLLSWRVAILPFIEHDQLYKEFKLDEPWDSAHNKKLIAKMPKLYEPVVGAKKDAGLTKYQVFTGPGTPFNGILKIKLTEIIDGTSNTILAVEGKDAVIWTKPADLSVPKEKDKLPAMGGMFSNGFHVLMCDGSVRLVANAVTPDVFRPMITPRGRD